MQLFPPPNATNLAMRDHLWLSDLIFPSICSLGFCIGLCHLACHKVIFLSFWGLLNAGWHHLRSYVKPILRVISQCIIIKSNTLCVICCLEQTKLGKLFPSVLYLETKSGNTRTCVHSQLLTDLHVAKIWRRIFLYRCPTNVSNFFYISFSSKSYSTTQN